MSARSIYVCSTREHLPREFGLLIGVGLAPEVLVDDRARDTRARPLPASGLALPGEGGGPHIEECIGPGDRPTDDRDAMGIVLVAGMP